MMTYKFRIALLALCVGLMAFFQTVSPLMAEKLPNSVQFKVDRCIESLNDAEVELDARNPDMAREPLRVAKERLESIKEYQSGSWDHPDVVAARDRYEALKKRYDEAQEKQNASAGKAEEQLEKLKQFRQFNPGATYPEELVASLPQYQAAKALIDEIKADGTDVQLSGYSDYNMTKLSVEVWERDRDKVTNEFIDTAKGYTKKNVSRSQEWLDKADQRLADLAKVLASDDPKLAEAKTTIGNMHTFIRQEQLEKAAKVFMSPEKYKGKDANALRALAKKAVKDKYPKAVIMKVKLTSSKWGPPEGGAQWTDNTYSAVEVRTTSYFSVEIAAKHGQDVMLHRVYLYKSKVNGQMQSAKSYIVGSQMMLEKNVK
ncbi:hypothetical protein LLG46_04525 [bacterium]|nr:hypothetical protein [bacterium]